MPSHFAARKTSLAGLAGLGSWAVRTAPHLWNEYSRQRQCGVISAPFAPTPRDWASEPRPELADVPPLHQLRQQAVAQQRSGQPGEVRPGQRYQADRCTQLRRHRRGRGLLPRCRRRRGRGLLPRCRSSCGALLQYGGGSSSRILRHRHIQSRQRMPATMRPQKQIQNPIPIQIYEVNPAKPPLRIRPIFLIKQTPNTAFCSNIRKPTDVRPRSASQNHRHHRRAPGQFPHAPSTTAPIAPRKRAALPARAAKARPAAPVATRAMPTR